MIFKALIAFAALTFVFLDPHVSASLQQLLNPEELENDIDSEYELQQSMNFPDLPFNCSIEGNTGECCGRLKVTSLKLNKMSCVKLIYIGERTALNITFSIDDKVLFNREISANNPPSICVGMPQIRFLADICIEFYNLQITSSYMHVCLQMQPRVMRKEITNIQAGCFNMTSDQSDNDSKFF